MSLKCLRQLTAGQYDYSNTVEDYSKEDNNGLGGQSSGSTLQSPVVIQNKPGVGSGGETFYYPTSEVEDAGYYHHKQSHHEAQAPWLAASKATSSSKIPATTTTYLVMHFLLAISVLQWVVTLQYVRMVSRHFLSLTFTIMNCTMPSISDLIHTIVRTMLSAANAKKSHHYYQEVFSYC